MLTAAFPSGVLGPVDFCALRRFASICKTVAISLSFILANKAKLAILFLYFLLLPYFYP